LIYPSDGFILVFLQLYLDFFFFLQLDRDCVLWIRSFHKTASFEIPKRYWTTHLGNNKVECLIKQLNRNAKNQHIHVTHNSW